MNAFNNIEKKDLDKLFKCLHAINLNIKKGGTIISNLSNTDTICIIIDGSASVIRIDYNGNKSLIDTLHKDDIFESKMFNLNNSELSIIANEETNVIIIEYGKFINRCKKNCPYHNQFIDNTLSIILNKLNDNYERIQILTKKSTREKLREYFTIVSNKRGSKRFRIPLSYSDLANYLAVDRSAMMREIKYLKEDNLIEVENRIITIKY